MFQYILVLSPNYSISLRLNHPLSSDLTLFPVFLLLELPLKLLLKLILDFLLSFIYVNLDAFKPIEDALLNALVNIVKVGNVVDKVALLRI